MSRIPIRTALATSLAIVFAACLAASLVRWPIRDPGFRAMLVHGLEASTGLRIEATGPLTLRLLPAPTFRIASVTMKGGGGAIDLEADALQARLGLLALVSGRRNLERTTLERPTISLDMDRLLPILRAMTGSGEHAGALSSLMQTHGLSVRDGAIRLRSTDPRLDGLLTDVYATWTWPPDGAASLSGRAAWRGHRGEVSALVDAPLSIFTGRTSPVYLRVRSDPLDLTVTGSIVGGSPDLTGGHVIAATHDLPRFLRLVGTPFPALDAVGEARLSGDWTLPAGLLDLRNTRLELDDMLFEGAMAFHQNDGRPGLSGTLATDRMELAPFLKSLPGPRAADGSWSSAMLQTRALAYDDIDLRISATRATLGPITFDDSGLSLQSGGGRLEFSLGEARSEDGLIKGRVIAQANGEQTDVRAEANVSQINLGGLFKRLGFGPVVTGTSTGRLTIEAVGDSPEALAGSANGQAELSIRDGAVRPSLASGVVRSVGEVATRLPAASLGFDAALVDLRLSNGSASIERATITRPDKTYALAGSLSLREQTLDCKAMEDGRDAVLARLHGPWSRLDLDLQADDRGKGP